MHYSIQVALEIEEPTKEKTTHEKHTLNNTQIYTLKKIAGEPGIGIA